MGNQKHIVIVTPTGDTQFTRNPDLETIFGGRGRMHRVSDIQKVPDEPLYVIFWLDGPFAQQYHRPDMAVTYDVPRGSGQVQRNSVLKEDDVLVFPSYEAAVAHEIEMLNAIRVAGYLFD
jgi:hypothetical protein